MTPLDTTTNIARRRRAARILLGLAQVSGTAGILLTGAALHAIVQPWHRQLPPELGLAVAAVVLFGIALAAEVTGIRLRNRSRLDRRAVRS